MKTCISCKFHGLGSRLGARRQLSRWLGRARHIRSLICSVTTLLSTLDLLGQVVGLSLDQIQIQILAFVDAVIRVLTERAGDRGGTLASAARCE